MKTRKEKLLALALDRGATPEGQLAALRYLGTCDDWKEIQLVDVTRWWERPECGNGFDVMSAGCEAVANVRDGRPCTGTLYAAAVHPTVDATVEERREYAADENAAMADFMLDYAVVRIRTAPSSNPGTVCIASVEIVRPNCRAQLVGGGG